MAEIILQPGSWLNLTNLLEFNGVIFWDQTDLPDVPFDDDDTYIQITADQAKRPDLIANDTWGDSDLWWVVLLANDIDLPNQLVEGQTLRLPAKNTIDQILTTNKQNVVT